MSNTEADHKYKFGHRRKFADAWKKYKERAEKQGIMKPVEKD